MQKSINVSRTWEYIEIILQKKSCFVTTWLMASYPDCTLMLKLSSLSPSSDLDRMLLMWWNTLLWCRNWWSDCLNLRLQHLCEVSGSLVTHHKNRWLCNSILEWLTHLRAICWRELPLGSDIIRSEMVWRSLWKVWGRGWAASPAMTMSERGCSHTPKSFSCSETD